MKVYVASRLTNAKEAKRIQQRFISEGCEITYDWTIHGQALDPEQLKTICEAEEQGVITADVLFMVFPAGIGSHWEAGIARGLQLCRRPHQIYTPIEIVILFNKEQPIEMKSFYYAPTIKKFYDEDEAIAYSLEFMKTKHGN